MVVAVLIPPAVSDALKPGHQEAIDGFKKKLNNAVMACCLVKYPDGSLRLAATFTPEMKAAVKKAAETLVTDMGQFRMKVTIRLDRLPSNVHIEIQMLEALEDVKSEVRVVS